MPEQGSTYAQEGTLAHAYGALKLKTFLGLDTSAEQAEIAQLSSLYHTGEMDEYTDTYTAIVLERYNAAKAETPDARLLVETRLDFSDYVPDAFGTSDATIIADGTMEIIDLKYGKGVRVDARDNPQMMIYALGAYSAHGLDYDIDRVRMTIVQPRIDNLSTAEMPASELLEWAERELKPKAAEAFRGGGAQNPGAWCQFCKVKSLCRALADRCTSVTRENPDTGLLTPGEIAADILPWLPIMKSWITGMEEYALQQALSGVAYDGYKLVAGRSVRRITDEEAVTAILAGEGYDRSEFMKPATLCGLTDLEKLVGKKRLAVLCDGYITKPQGKPALVPESDKRPVYNSAAEDFKDF